MPTAATIISVLPSTSPRRHAVDQTVDCLDGNAADTDKSTTAFVREARMELRP
jgi:hypothetical protein